MNNGPQLVRTPLAAMMLTPRHFRGNENECRAACKRRTDAGRQTERTAPSSSGRPQPEASKSNQTRLL